MASTRSRLALLLGLFVLALPRHARASELELSFDLHDYFLRSMPPMDLQDPRETDVRTVPRSNVASTGPQHFFAATLDFALILRDRWRLPMLGAVLGGAIGRSPRVWTSADGTMVTLRPWTAGAFTLLGPGLGVRVKYRRWMIGASVRTLMTYIWMGASIANGPDSFELEDPGVSALGFGVRADLEVCRRLDPTLRVCLFGAPHVLEFGLLNGISFGLRTEFGP
jgi:hypothetical protein